MKDFWKNCVQHSLLAFYQHKALSIDTAYVAMIHTMGPPGLATPHITATRAPSHCWRRNSSVRVSTGQGKEERAFQRRNWECIERGLDSAPFMPAGSYAPPFAHPTPALSLLPAIPRRAISHQVYAQVRGKYFCLLLAGLLISLPTTEYHKHQLWCDCIL